MYSTQYIGSVSADDARESSRRLILLTAAATVLSLIGKARNWAQRKSEFRQLQELDDRQLRDIGLSRKDVGTRNTPERDMFRQTGW